MKKRSGNNNGKPGPDFWLFWMVQPCLIDRTPPVIPRESALGDKEEQKKKKKQ